ncbi:MAG: hypothetical protein KGL39_35245 [Patescibacteria group bacterium]|nr:hypothetical protein [Patescibacteria group bacterium]
MTDEQNNEADVMQRLSARIHEQEEVIQAAYRERNAVVAALGRLFPSWVGTDAEEPDWPVLYISLPTGQVSWHFSAADANLLDGIPRGDGVWDGHTTAEKYARLAALGAASSATGEETNDG